MRTCAASGTKPNDLDRVRTVLPAFEVGAQNMKMTEYRVLFANARPSSVNISADKVNLGSKKVWFYDAEDRLIAVCQWNHPVGFEVVGSAAEQVFTDSLLHADRPSSNADRAEAIEQRGTLVVLLEEALATLIRAKNDIRGPGAELTTRTNIKPRWNC
jgi:hypothetical protein